MNDNKINLDEELDNPFNFDNLDFSEPANSDTSKNKHQASRQESDLLNELNELANKATEKIKNKEAERHKAEAEKAKKKEYNKVIIIGIVLALLICFTVIFSSLGKKVTNNGKRTPSNKTISQSEFSSPVNSSMNINSGSNNRTNIPSKPVNRQGFENNPM